MILFWENEMWLVPLKVELYLFIATCGKCSETHKITFDQVILLIQICPGKMIKNSDKDLYDKIVTKVLFIIMKHTKN